MASFPEFMPTTPRLLNGFHTTMNDTDIDDVTDEDLTSSSSSSSSYEYPRSLDLLTDVPVFTVYAITFLVGMTGNLLVIFAVVKSRRLHNVTCLFLANLAVADLLTVVFLIPLQIIVHSSDYWNLGDVLCRLAAYVGVISPVCSVFTMMIISLERYYVVLHPLQARSFVTMGRAKRVIAALWFFSCIFSSPALFSKKVTAHYWEEEPEPYSYTCNSAWPNETLSILYSVYLFLLLFFVPLIVVSYAYMRIACHLNSTRERSGEANGSPFNRPVLPRYRVWYRNTSGWSSGSSFVRRAEAASQANGVTIDEDAPEAEALRSEPGRVENLNDSPAPRRHRGTSEGDKIQRVITMLAIVVALFILSWGPLLTYTLVYRFIDDMPYNTHAVLSLFLHLLAACNSCINPIIYAFLSKNFRQSFKQVIRECCCCCESLHRRRLAYQPSFRWTSSTRASYSYSPPESCMRVSPQRSTVSQKTDV